MPNTPFRFKQFTIQQDKSSMKVGTDAVLLGSWVITGQAKNILDIGTGTGVLSIMLAQKSFAIIDSIDIDLDSCEQAKHNAIESPWAERIHIQHISLQNFCKSYGNKYDLIVSNPPYFEEGINLGIDAKVKAKHTHTLSYHDLISSVNSLLVKFGKFCVILPFQEGTGFIELAKTEGLYCRKRMRVITKKGKPEKRLMMEFRTESGFCEEQEIIVQDENLHFTNDYIELTKDFYLGLK